MVLPKDRLDAIRFSLGQDNDYTPECKLLRKILGVFVDPAPGGWPPGMILSHVRTVFTKHLQETERPDGPIEGILTVVLNTPTTATLVEDDAGARLAAVAELALALLRFNEHVY